MQVEEELTKLVPERDTLLTIGVFDGVHRGHQYLISQLKEKAERGGFLSGVVTFRQHPQTALSPETKLPYLTDLDERASLLRGVGVGLVAVLSFTPELAQLGAREFISLLKRRLRMRGLVIGPDFALGRGREGDVVTLQAMGDEMDFSVTVIPPMVLDGEVVSSTAIRKALAAGQQGVSVAFDLATHRGYDSDRKTRVDLEVDLERTDLDTSDAEKRLRAEGIVLRRAHPAEIATASRFALENFSAVWQAEVAHSADFCPPPLFIALEADRVVAFAAYDVDGTARFGPMGTLPSYRRRGIGAALLKMCLRSIRDNGYLRSEIGWAGPIGFYARTVNARIHRAYWTFGKSLVD